MSNGGRDSSRRGRKTAWVLLLVAAGLILLYMLRGGLRSGDEERGRVVPAKGPAPLGEPRGGRAGAASPGAAPDALLKILSTSKKASALYQAALDAARDVSFTGRVLDQNKAPVVGAAITYDVGGNYYGRSSGTAVVTTDQHGIFQVRGAVGSVLMFMKMKAPGYQISVRGQESTYTEFGDADTKAAAWKNCTAAHPCEFLAWKYPDGRMPPIYRRSESGGAPPTGDPTSLDFYEPSCNIVRRGAGKGQVEFRFTPIGPQVEMKKQLWRLLVTATDGGLQVATGLYTNEAPLDGYVKEIAISGQGYESSELHTFYVKLASRNAYARLTLEPDYSGRFSEAMSLGIDFSINSEHGRELETYGIPSGSMPRGKPPEP